ncbi:MAG: hypothetical protein ACR2GP_11515 [Burkholderiaceae bacterium]
MFAAANCASCHGLTAGRCNQHAVREPHAASDRGLAALDELTGLPVDTPAMAMEPPWSAEAAARLWSHVDDFLIRGVTPGTAPGMAVMSSMGRRGAAATG